MAAVLRGILWNDRDGGQADDFKESFTVGFLVECTKGEAQLTALACAALPAMYSAYDMAPYGVLQEEDQTVRVKGRTARQHDNHPRLWAVSIAYGSDCKNPLYQAKNPLERFRRVRHSFERYQRAVSEDEDGNPIVNSAGDPYDPPLQVEAYRLVVTVEKNLNGYDAAFLKKFLNAVNTDQFMDFEAGECKVHDIECPGEEFDHNVAYWPTKLVIHVDDIDTDLPPERGEHPWRDHVLDVGVRQYTSGSYRAILDPVTGRQVSQPVPLDGAGAALTAPGGYVYNTFRNRKEIPFADLAGLFLT